MDFIPVTKQLTEELILSDIAFKHQLTTIELSLNRIPNIEQKLVTVILICQILKVSIRRPFKSSKFSSIKHINYGVFKILLAPNDLSGKIKPISHTHRERLNLLTELNIRFKQIVTGGTNRIKQKGLIISKVINFTFYRFSSSQPFTLFIERRHRFIQPTAVFDFGLQLSKLLIDFIYRLFFFFLS